MRAKNKGSSSTDDIDALIELAKSDSDPKHCFVKSLPEDGKRFMNLARQLHEENGQRFSWREMNRILKERWGIHRGDQQVARHVRKVCSCKN